MLIGAEFSFSFWLLQQNLVTFTQVPKMLGTLRSTWAPQAFIVSFKLETDEQILIKKV